MFVIIVCVCYLLWIRRIQGSGRDFLLLISFRVLNYVLGTEVNIRIEVKYSLT